LTEKHLGGAFPEDSEANIWLFAQREECNLLYQSRLDPDAKSRDDVLHGPLMVEFRQAKEP
jgi:hypothetical protein